MIPGVSPIGVWCLLYCVQPPSPPYPVAHASHRSWKSWNVLDFLTGTFFHFIRNWAFFASNLSKLVLRQVLFRGHDANAYSIITFPFFMDCVARQTGILMLKHVNLAQHSQPRTRANTWKTHTDSQQWTKRIYETIASDFARYWIRKLLDLNPIPSLSLQNSLS